MTTMTNKEGCTCPTTPWRYDDPEPVPDEDCPMHGDPRVLRLPADPGEYVGPRDGCGFLHRHKCAGKGCDGSRGVSNDDDPFTDPGPAPDGPGNDGEPGPWFVAGFDGECSRGCPGITEGEQARADGEGGWECRSCVESDLDEARATHEAEAGPEPYQEVGL